MRGPQVHLAAVEVAQLAGPDVDGADGQPRVPAVQVLEIDQPRERRLERIGRVVGGLFDTDGIVHAEDRAWVGLEEAGYARA